MIGEQPQILVLLHKMTSALSTTLKAATSLLMKNLGHSLSTHTQTAFHWPADGQASSPL